MTMGKRYFGTDGIRGRVGEYPITPEFVLKLGWAVGRVLQTEGFNKVVIGKALEFPGTCSNQPWMRDLANVVRDTLSV
jgi:phosphoglucosamine mutase